MGKQFEAMSDRHVEFITAQKMFFVGTATADSRVNVSPKGMDALRVLDPNRIAWRNVTGSGNETSANVQRHPRMTVMFCAFDGPPMILRRYGTAGVIHPVEPEWRELFPKLVPLPGARQIRDLRVDLMQTCRGMAVPTPSAEHNPSAIRPAPSEPRIC
ncbi:MAG: pyridoxamine 5'-phosphate oxidase family protein [Betaproteobacteria bacterium]